MHRNHFYLLFLMANILVFLSCKEKHKPLKEATSKRITTEVISNNLVQEDFNAIIDEKKVKLYWLKSENIQLAITNLGGRLVGLWTPDKNGVMTDVVVGFSSLKAYLTSTEPYFGATIGRVGNRIAKGKFQLLGYEYTIPINNGENSLHGGFNGFQYVIWVAEQPNESTLILSYLSPDMEEGFPGNLKVQVTYSLTNNNSVKIEYEAITDKSTPVNLTNHAFFNLNGEGSGTILNHSLQIDADYYTPVDSGLIPVGKLEKVENTPFDFRSSTRIGNSIETKNDQLKNGRGYDHNFVLNKTQVDDFNLAATVVGDKSGIQMDVYTKEPGLQFYSGNFMQGKNTFKSGSKDEFRTAFCLETQHFPDAPNQELFPSIILNPGEKYYSISEYKFSN